MRICCSPTGAGGRAAFEELVCRYERGCSIISGGTGDADMAEDAFQATFLRSI